MGKSEIVLLALFLAPAPFRAGTNVWTSHGPPGGQINALAVDNKNSSTLYVSAGNGVLFKSTDGGWHWNPLSGLPNQSYRLWTDPQEPDTVYALAGPLFKSTDGGQSWNALSVLPADVFSLTLDPQNAGTLYAAGNSGVSRSTDGGATWTLVSSGLRGLGAATLAISGQDTPALYAGVFTRNGAIPGAVFRSADGGANWTLPLQQKLLNLGLPDTNTCDTWNYYFARVTGRDSPPADQLSCYPEGNRGLEITVDQYLTALQTFATRRPDAANFGLVGNVRTLLGDPQNPGRVYALTARGIFMSTDGALTWDDANAGLQGMYNIATLTIDPENPGTMYAGLSFGGRFYKTTDGARSWNQVPSGLPGNGGVNVVVVDPQDPGTIYAGTSSGLYKTTDTASNWSLQESGLADGNISSLLVDPRNPGTVYAGAGAAGLYKTSDGGMAWTKTGFPASAGGFAVLLAIDPRNSAVLYASASGPGGPSLFKSTDGGTSWLNTGLAQFPAPLLIDPRDSNTLYARSGLVNGGIIKSTDGGNTWSAINSGLGGTGAPNSVPALSSLTLDPQNPDTLYCIRYSDGQMFRTTDGGASWNPVNAGWNAALFHVGPIIADPQNSGTLYAGTQEFDCGYYDVCPPDYYNKVAATPGPGLYKSTDGGQSWAKLDLPMSNPALVAIDPRKSSTLYVAAFYSSRVYRSTDGGATWSLVNSGLISPVSVLAVDGQDPSTVYAGTQGGGVFAITFPSQ